MPEITVRFLHSGDRPEAFQVDRLPDVCPLCDRGGRPDVLVAAQDEHERLAFTAVFICPLEKCRGFYIGFYRGTLHDPRAPWLLTNFGRPYQYADDRKFSAEVSGISPSFKKIFNQAAAAEAGGLTEVCGPGYRRAFEFLIKDFILGHEVKDAKEDQREKVRKAPLAACIANYITDERIKKAAKRAAWLGNDETHYTRKWETHDLADLKQLIDITVSWIDLVIGLEKYEEEMPEGKK